MDPRRINSYQVDKRSGQNLLPERFFS